MQSPTAARLASLVLAAGLSVGTLNAYEPMKFFTHDQPAAVDDLPDRSAPLVQVALLLDTSNSMDGLINQAKAALWATVNELGKAKDANGRPPRLEVALYEYGNDSISAEKGHVRQRTAFISDLDVVSEKLFALSTNGGSEYCGRVIDEAVRSLVWKLGPSDHHLLPEPSSESDRKPAPLAQSAMNAIASGIAGGPSSGRTPTAERVGHEVIRLVVIAGNEPFTQGAVAYRDAIAEARALNVVVSTIHCGNRQTGAQTGWEDGARLGGGLYAHIDQNESVAEPPTPYDDRIKALNVKLNTTYLGFNTPVAADAQPRQAVQDSMNEADGFFYRRAESKLSANYNAAGWDIVDAVKQNELKLADIEPETLPKDFKDMTLEQMQAAIDDLWTKRQAVQAEIRAVLDERAEYIKQLRASLDKGDAPETLDQAIVRSLREQAERAGLELPKAE